jgi:hypothetical protein
VPSDRELEALGAVIGDIYINNENIFNLENPDDNTVLFRLADSLHVKTRAGVIKNELLFHSGDRYSRRLLDETERILRSNQYFYDAWIVPVSYHDGQVDLRITTRDVWTLDPGFHFGRSGGTNSTGIQLEELNVAGSGAAATVAHTTTVDRSQSSAGVADSNIFGTWVTASGVYANQSDGMNRQITLARPFYSLETRYALGMTDKGYDQTDSLYDRGQIIDQFHDTHRYWQGYGGWSSGVQNGWVQRLITGVTYDEHVFAALPSISLNPGVTVSPSVIAVPATRRYLYPWVEYDLLQDAYAQVMNHDQILRTEDFYLGTSVTVQIGFADRSVDSTSTAILFQSSASKGFGDPNHTLLLLSGTFNGRLEEGKLRNALLSAAIRCYLTESPHWLFFTTLSGAKGWSLPLDQEVLLGGDNGLRGYPLRYQDGTERGLLTVEQRYFTDLYLFRLLRVGAAIFFDAGRTWGQAPLAAPSLGLLKDAGFGLRFGNARSGLGNVVHVDLAFPFDGDPSIQRVQLLISTESQF